MNKKSTPNWKNIRRLRNRLAKLKETEHKQFFMSDYIRILSGKKSGQLVSVAELRKNGPACGSACCMAGETVVSMGPPELAFRIEEVDRFESYDGRISAKRVFQEAKKILGLTKDEAEYMFHGDWICESLGNIITEDAVHYLDMVLESKDVMVHSRCDYE